MKAFTERDNRVIGLVVIVAAAVIVLGVLMLNRSVFTPSYTVHARFADAAGIGKGAPVTIAGVKVGAVSGVHLQGDTVVADLALDHGTVLPARTAAAIEVQTVLGVLDVALKPESGWSHPLQAGATITDTSVPVEFQDLENTAGTLLQQSDVSAFNQLISSLASVTQGKQAEVAAILSGLDRFTGVIDSRKGQVSGLIDAANTLASTVAGRDQQLAGVVDNLSTVVQGLAARSADLAQLVQSVEQFAAQTSSLVGQNQPQILGLLSHLNSILAVVQQHQEDLAQGVAYLTSGLRGFSSIGYSGPADAPNSWGNIYDQLLGTAGGYGVLGNCGALDEALTAAFGPDPLPCDAQSGPLVGSTSQLSGGPGGAQGTTTSATSGPGTKAGTKGSAASAGSAPNPLQQLLSPLLEG
ncbi:MAG TPA: MCE family protein [Acidimicrobiales bacterium]|nr:MCE family protein [Acidimicrobiales bacterium]